MSPRLVELRHWIARQHGLSPSALRLEPIAGDASFRSYCRVEFPDRSTRMVMDAPPALEDSRPFVAIGRTWQNAGLPVPTIHALDLAQGFIELDDLGDDSLHHHFASPEGAREGTRAALALLDEIQRRAPADSLPAYDLAFLEEEMDRFPEWGLARWLNLDTPPMWPEVKRALLSRIEEMPTVAVHRDFDAMNLMRRQGRLWIIDFQGALAGPLGYDLVSLLRGRYHRWSRQEMNAWIDEFRRRAEHGDHTNPTHDEERFRGAVEAIGAQRQLKILGQFCRLSLRDGKPRYLDWLPHFHAHLDDGLEALPELAEFHDWLRDVYHPAMVARLRAHHTASASGDPS